MGNFVSTKSRKRKAESNITEVDKAILSLKTQRRKLNTERKRLEEIIDKNVAAIKELVAKKQKDKALLALKKKKMRTDQLKNVDNWLLHVEELLGTIEFSQQQNAIFSALRTGADALKDIQKEVKVEDVDKLTEDTVEAKAYLDEIHEALGQDPPELVAELEDELNALEEQMAEELKLSLPTAPIVPAVEPPVAVEEPEQPPTEQPLLA